MEIIYKEEAYRIIGACFEVYKEKGCGFLEAVYQECLAIEFSYQRIPYLAQAHLPLEYKGTRLRQFYVADFLCNRKIIVEIKAQKALADENRAQTINYLKATGYKLGILVNFGHNPRIEYQRFINL